MPGLINCCGVLLIHMPPNAASAMNSFVAGVRRVYGANIIGTIPWSIPGFFCGGKTGMVQ